MLPLIWTMTVLLTLGAILNDPEDITGYSLVGKITDDKALMDELTAFFSKLCNNTHTIKILDYKFDTSDGENNLKNYYYNDPGPEED